MQLVARIAVFTVYLVATTGLYVHMHYCCGELSNIGLFGACAHDCCDESESPNCCDSENIYISLEDEHRNIQPTSAPVITAVHQAARVTTPETVLDDQALPADPGLAHAPPDPVYIRFQRLIYYG